MAIKRVKNPTAVRVGGRIKQARQMAGFTTQKSLCEQLPDDWGNARLGGYEAGYAIPHPDDVELLAMLTGSSACWIMFGIGPIRADARDLQAIRYQNLVYIAGEAKKANQLYVLIDTLAINEDIFMEHLTNPKRAIGVRFSRKLEKISGFEAGWLDEQHIESDGLCANFPTDLREIMVAFSELDEVGQEALLVTSRALRKK